MTTRAELEANARDVGAAIAACMLPGTGFVFIAFDFGAKGNMAFLSNAQREDTIALLRELADKLESEGD